MDKLIIIIIKVRIKKIPRSLENIRLEKSVSKQAKFVNRAFFFAI